MSKHLEEIIERHFPEQPQVYPNRDKARSAILEYAAWEASFLADKPQDEAGKEVAYWQNRARQAEARVKELEESLHSTNFGRPPWTANYLGDPGFRIILFPWTKNLAIQ